MNDLTTAMITVLVAYAALLVVGLAVLVAGTAQLVAARRGTQRTRRVPRESVGHLGVARSH